MSKELMQDEPAVKNDPVMREEMWCRCHMHRGQIVYDLETLAWSKERAIKKWRAKVSMLDKKSLDRVMSSARYERVTLTICISNLQTETDEQQETK